MKHAKSLLTLLVLPLASYADDFDYTFVDAGFVNTEVDVGPFNVDGDGIGIQGSFAIQDNLQIVASYTDIDYDFGVDGSVLTVGLGFNTGLNDNLDFVADISYVDAEVSSGLASADETGYEIGAGIRARTGQKVELEAGLSYIDLDSSDTVLKVGGRYYFSDAFALSAGFSDNDDGLSWTIGGVFAARYPDLTSNVNSKIWSVPSVGT